MTKASIALAELVEKGAGDEIVHELLSHVVERLMEFEIEQRTGAEYGERSPAQQQPQRVPRSPLGDARRLGRPADPQIAARHLLPGLFGAASDR